MSGLVTASLVVNLGPAAAAAGELVAEVDSRAPDEGGLNQSTSFAAGQSSPVILVFGQGYQLGPPRVTIPTAVITALGGGLYSLDGYLDFTTGSEARQTLPRPVAPGTLSLGWHAPDAGVIQQTGQEVTVVDQDGAVRSDVFGVARYQYQAAYQAYRVSQIPADIRRFIFEIDGTPQ